jgi:hypothetical protein
MAAAVLVKGRGEKGLLTEAEAGGVDLAADDGGAVEGECGLVDDAAGDGLGKGGGKGWLEKRAREGREGMRWGWKLQGR